MSYQIGLRAWAEDDYWLLPRTVGDPAMTTFLGGPESDEKMRSRHEKYLAMNGSETGQMLVIVAGKDQTPVGTHGFWEKDWQNEIVSETGWFVLPGFQRRGIATQATKLIIDRLKVSHKHRFLHAYPASENVPSNAICHKLGFSLRGEVDFEYPKGHWLRCNDWQLDLRAE